MKKRKNKEYYIERNFRIFLACKKKIKRENIAKQFKISAQRVSQIYNNEKDLIGKHLLKEKFKIRSYVIKVLKKLIEKNRKIKNLDIILLKSSEELWKLELGLGFDIVNALKNAGLNCSVVKVPEYAEIETLSKEQLRKIGLQRIVNFEASTT
ncbi:MAG: hypothetical protein A2V66_16835 [Ignavibacteria bacterium RBG_13_36_8]|nr:MAG: hypothetical protein A2V66_16835 [Ignavibacteria bacterium RBG_13_36_8]